ncbi:hypothetical protein ACGFMK_44510 [Amycolatopsis sp. NPDC049252]|uniref:hypothetical protein n=1 Tax=Amycolatopsis sp. NPDC049252 TaxID=3363933 RepID=UPI0037110938
MSFKVTKACEAIRKSSTGVSVFPICRNLTRTAQVVRIQLKYGSTNLKVSTFPDLDPAGPVGTPLVFLVASRHSVTVGGEDAGKGRSLSLTDEMRREISIPVVLLGSESVD